MEARIRAMLYVYAVEDNPSDAQAFVFRGSRFCWFVRGENHVCIVRYGPRGQRHLTMWHAVETDTLVTKMNQYMQSV